jgi:hypothetical protein
MAGGAGEIEIDVNGMIMIACEFRHGCRYHQLQPQRVLAKTGVLARYMPRKLGYF